MTAHRCTGRGGGGRRGLGGKGQFEAKAGSFVFLSISAITNGILKYSNCKLNGPGIRTPIKRVLC